MPLAPIPQTYTVQRPKKILPKDTFYATDDVISAILGPSDELLGKLRLGED